ncbi:MAG: TROVE domain-containing protein [Methanosarcina sp.]|nr:TROVE domain-containing protein [Methanosarcina sp.]
MAKFNSRKTSEVRNLAGGLAEPMTPKTELMTRVLTCFVDEPGAYGNQDKELMLLIERVLARDPLYILKLAIYARKEMHMRSVPILLWTMYANNPNKNIPDASSYGLELIQRADEILEMMSAQKAMYPLNRRAGNSVKLPRITKVVIRKAMNKFDAYQFGKYNGGSGEFKFRDAIFMTHPTPKDIAQQTIFQKLVDQTLESPDTWEVKISSAGSNRKAWEEVFPKMGYMALLRNLRNFEKVGMDLDEVAARLTDVRAVQNSKQFPFRFLSAFDAVTFPELKAALSEAINISVGNIERMPGKTLVLVDVSGSMNGPLAKESSMTRYKVASVLGAISPKIFEGTTLIAFASDFAQIVIPPKTSVLQAASMFRKDGRLGCGTDAYKPIIAITQQKLSYDRIILLSDMQCYGSGRFSDISVAQLFNNYTATVNPNCKLYSIDLAGYGTAQLDPDNPNVFLMAGWSEKVLTLIPFIEENDMVEIIETYECFVR